MYIFRYLIFFIDNIDAYDRKNIRKFKLLLNFYNSNVKVNC